MILRGGGSGLVEEIVVVEVVGSDGEFGSFVGWGFGHRGAWWGAGAVRDGAGSEGRGGGVDGFCGGVGGGGSGLLESATNAVVGVVVKLVVC